MLENIPADCELYDPNNPEHNDPSLYEVVEYETELDSVSPEVGTIEEDAKRRDFTNSALYIKLKGFELLDPTGDAINDCFSNTLRFVGKPKDRILEDPLRVFRGYRMINRGWEVDKKTLKAMRENFDFATKNVSSTRIMNELEKMVKL